MTCIVGYVENNRVFIGGDSAGVAGYSIQVRSDAKVFQNEDCIFGFTSSFRMGQVLRYKLQLPKCETWDIERYMCTTFIDAVKSCFKENGINYHDSGQDFGGVFLVGLKGRLFRIDSDYQVAWNDKNYDSVGCGEDLAVGALFALEHMDRTQISAEDRITIALDAASTFSGAVTPPYTIISI